MDSGSIAGWSGLVLSIIGIIYSAINHKHIRMRLCNRSFEFSIDVDSTENVKKKEEEEEKKREEEEKKREEQQKKREEEEKKKKDEEKKKSEEEIKIKLEEEKKKAEEEKKKISFTPRVFKIQPLNF